MLAPSVANAQFTQNWTDNVRGDIRLAGNPLLSCAETGQAPADSCADVLDGTTNASNSSFVMNWIDVDSDPTTDNSSSAGLTLPAGAQVLNAQLIWNGNNTPGFNPNEDEHRPLYESVVLDTPAAGGYIPVTADTLLVDGAAFQGVADVTALVQAGGSGTYTLGDAFVRAGSGNLAAGWTLLVAYEHDSEPWRNLSIYTGFERVSPGNDGEVNLTNFVTPPAPAPVNAQLGAVVYDGDADFGSDQFWFNGTQLEYLPDAPMNNFFRSRITDLGAAVPDRTPYAVNNLGYEWKRLDVSPYISNGDTSALAEFQTASSSEQYVVGAFTAAIELFTPDVTVEKSVSNVNRPGLPAHRGDLLEYTIEVQNGDAADIVDDAADLVITDPIPAGTTYEPGSLAQVSGEPLPVGGRSDASGDDSAEFDAGAQEVVFRIGSGANASDGGTLAAGESSTVSFRVRVDDDHLGGSVMNTATADYRAVTLDQDFSEDDSTTYIVADVADLALRKRAIGKPAAGAPFTYRLIVTNNGPTTTTGTVTDTLPAGVTYISHSGAFCSTMLLPTIVCNAGPLANGASQTIDVRVRVKPGATGRLTNSASVTGPHDDPDVSNNDATTTNRIQPPRLVLKKKAARKSARPGEVVPFKITVKNRGRGVAQNVRVCDKLPAGLRAVKAPGAAKRSAKRVCWKLGTLASGAKRTLRVNALVLASTRPGKVRNKAVLNARNKRRQAAIAPLVIQQAPGGPCGFAARC